MTLVEFAFICVGVLGFCVGVLGFCANYIHVEGDLAEIKRIDKREREIADQEREFGVAFESMRKQKPFNRGATK